MTWTRGGKVSAIADDLGWTRKHLACWLWDRTGMRPAQFTRLARFERFTSAMQREPQASLAALACDAGYADQAHLTHGARRLTGITPGAPHGALLPRQRRGMQLALNLRASGGGER